MERQCQGAKDRVEPIKVLLGDDHTMFREGLAKLLTSYDDIEIMGTSDNGPQVVEMARREKPDVVVMQIETPIEQTIRSIREILEISPQPKIAIVTMFANPYYVRKVLDQGASAYLMKSAGVEDLIDAVRNVTSHRAPEKNKLVVGISREALEMAEGRSGHTLTKREMEILLMAARGLSNHRIAKSLEIEETTVKRHLANIYQKTGVSSRGEAVNKAISEGWISLPEIVRATEGKTRLDKNPSALPHP